MRNQVNANWRVADDPPQWALQCPDGSQREKASGWAGRKFIRNRDHLLRCIGELCGKVDPQAIAIIKTAADNGSETHEHCRRSGSALLVRFFDSDLQYCFGRAQLENDAASTPAPKTPPHQQCSELQSVPSPELNRQLGDVRRGRKAPSFVHRYSPWSFWKFSGALSRYL